MSDACAVTAPPKPSAPSFAELVVACWCTVMAGRGVRQPELWSNGFGSLIGSGRNGEVSESLALVVLSEVNPDWRSIAFCFCSTSLLTDGSLLLVSVPCRLVEVLLSSFSSSSSCSVSLAKVKTGIKLTQSLIMFPDISHVVPSLSVVDLLSDVIFFILFFDFTVLILGNCFFASIFSGKPGSSFTITVLFSFPISLNKYT